MPRPDPLGPRHRRVQRLRRLVRRSSVRAQEQTMVLEGVKLLEEALRAGHPVEAVFVAPEADDAVVDRAADAGARVFAMQPGVLESVADTVTPQPLIALAPWCDRPLDSLRDARLVLVAVDVRDPGNAGTLVRSAEAAGADGVVFCTGTVDIFNPKCVRASAGSLFHLDVVRGGEPTSVLDQLRSWPLDVLGTAARGGRRYDESDLGGRVALVLGNEARGLAPDVASRLDGVVTIPIEGRGESLNVGVAAAVLCFEAARQRRAATAGRGGAP